MPISHVSKLFSVEDAKIAVVTDDPVGGTTTYGSLIDVPGIKTVGLEPDIAAVSLLGDNTELDSDSTLKAVTLSFEHAKVSLDLLDAIIGGAVTDSGTGATEIATYVRVATDAFSYFKFEAKTPTNGVDTVGGDLHVVLWKCKVTSFSFGFAEQDYQTVSMEARAVARLSDGRQFSLIGNETAAAIA